MRDLRIINLLILLILTLGCLSVRAQDELPRAIRALDREDYQKLVELMFPLDELDSPKNEFTLVLRYAPSFESNQQIVIAGRDEKIFVAKYVSNGNIWNKSIEFLESGGRADLPEIARFIGVRKGEFNLSAKLEQSWRAELIESAAKALKTEKLREKPKPGQPLTATIILDGTTYEMWYVSGNSRLYFSEYGTEVTKPVFNDESNFIRRMKLIYREIDQQK